MERIKIPKNLSIESKIFQIKVKNPTSNLIFELINSNNSIFKVDSNSGFLILKKPLNQTFYLIQIKVRNSLESIKYTIARIFIEIENNFEIKFEKILQKFEKEIFFDQNLNLYSILMQENRSTEIFQLNLFNPENELIEFYLNEFDSDYFQINKFNGKINSKNLLDFEKQQFYNFGVFAKNKKFKIKAFVQIYLQVNFNKIYIFF